MLLFCNAHSSPLCLDWTDQACVPYLFWLLHSNLWLQMEFVDIIHHFISEWVKHNKINKTRWDNNKSSNSLVITNMNCTSNRELDFSYKYSVKRNTFCRKPHWTALSSLHQRMLIYVESTYLEKKAHLITFLINSFIFQHKEAFLQDWNVYRLNLHRKWKEDPAHLVLSLNSFQSHQKLIPFTHSTYL